MILDYKLLAFAAVALVMIVFITVVFRSKKNDFEFSDLFMEDGKTSLGGTVLMGAFAATTWAFVYMAMTGKMTEMYLGIYGALWIAPIVAKMITKEKPHPIPGLGAPSTTTTTTTETEVK